MTEIKRQQAPSHLPEITDCRHGRALPARSTEGAQHATETSNIADAENGRAARVEGACSQGKDWPLESLQTQETVLQHQAAFLPRWRRFRTCRQPGQFIRASIKVRNTV